MEIERSNWSENKKKELANSYDKPPTFKFSWLKFAILIVMVLLASNEKIVKFIIEKIGRDRIVNNIHPYCRILYRYFTWMTNNVMFMTIILLTVLYIVDIFNDNNK